MKLYIITVKYRVNSIKLLTLISLESLAKQQF